LIKLFSDPGRNILGETFHSMASIPFGDYIAKISVAYQNRSVGSRASQLNQTMMP
jgi:hypothetical protein